MALLKGAKSNNFTNFTSLYNGNIGAMITDLKHFADSSKHAFAYGYDQLNRILSTDRHKYATSWGQDAKNGYETSYSYDRNGNLETLIRLNSGGGTLHNFNYVYYDGTNKLKNIAGNTTENYRYDAIGNLISDASENIDTIQWTVYGKVARVVKSNNVEVSYVYDAAGNRVTKTFENDTATIITRYIRDSSGNVMAIYDDTTVIERPIYGSSRLGMLKGLANRGELRLGLKVFELSNHLGNVLTTISDRKLPVSNSGTVTHYEPDILSTSDYYPFGLAMEGRTFSSEGYRWGFNGVERDNDIFSDGYAFKYRIQDAKIGRFLSVDPLAPEYPWNSTYAFAENSVIAFMDLEGLEKYYAPDLTYLGQVGGSNEIRLINDYAIIKGLKESTDELEFIVENARAEQNDGYEGYFSDFLNQKSSPIDFDYNHEKIKKMWNDSYPEAKTEAERKERAGYIVLNLFTAEMDLIVHEDKGNTFEKSYNPLRVTDEKGNNYYPADTYLVMAQVHTHPNGYHRGFETIPNENDQNLSKLLNAPLYTLGHLDELDKLTPSALIDKYGNWSAFQIAKDAFETKVELNKKKQIANHIDEIYNSVKYLENK